MVNLVELARELLLHDARLQGGGNEVERSRPRWGGVADPDEALMRRPSGALTSLHRG